MATAARKPASRRREIPQGDVSKTRIELYESCPAAYRERYVVPYASRRPAPPSEDMLVGSLVHEVLAGLARRHLAREAAPEDLDAYTSSVADEQQESLGPDLRVRAARLVRKAAPRLELERLLVEGGKGYVESPWTLSLADAGKGPPVACGVFDRVDVEPQTGVVEVLDYKTGGVEGRRELEGDAQCVLYLAAAHARWPARDVRFVVWHLGPDARVSVEWTAELDHAGRAYARETWRRISESQRADAWPATPGEHCRRCPYQTGCREYEARVAARVVPEARDLATLPTETLARYRLELAVTEKLVEPERKRVDAELRSRLRGGELVLAGHRFRTATRSRYEDAGLDDVASALAPLLAREPLEVRSELALETVDPAKLEALLERAGPARKKAMEALAALRRTFDVSAHLDVRPVRDSF